MPDLPSGTVTFLFTDIEGSTALWERDRQVMADAVERQLKLLHAEIEAHGGVLVKTVGDAVQAAVPATQNALAAAGAGQRLFPDRSVCVVDRGASQQGQGLAAHGSSAVRGLGAQASVSGPGTGNFANSQPGK